MSEDYAGDHIQTEVAIDSHQPAFQPIQHGDAGPDPRDPRAEKEAKGARQYERDPRNAKAPKWESERQRNIGMRDALERGFLKAGITKDEPGKGLAEHGRAKLAERKEAKAPATDKVPHKDAAIRRQIIEKAFSKVEGKLSRKDLTTPEQREIRRDLVARYKGYGGSDRSIGEIAKAFFEWREMSKKDPVAARDQAMAAFMRITPYADSAKDDGKKGNAKALANAFDDMRDLHELAPYIEKYGAELPALMKEMAQFEKGMRDDPVGFSARIAAIHGAPVTAAEQHQYEQRKAVEAHHARRLSDASRGLELIVQHNLLPGFEHENMQLAVADVLSQNLIERTGDGLTDVTNAFHYVQQGAQHLHSARRTLEALGVKVPAGQKSISGAPNGDGKRPPAKSSRQALERALR